jgi:hypothetical protein
MEEVIKQVFRIRISVLRVGPYFDPEGQNAEFLHNNFEKSFF